MNNNQLKFRAWDIVGKGYINGFNMIGFSVGQGAPTAKLQRYDREWKIDQVILEQYTGLKDWDGKEIYEGDIIEFTHSESKKTYKYQIIFVGGSFDVNIPTCCEHCKNNHASHGSLNETLCHPTIVIGNIHENPELLEALHA